MDTCFWETLLFRLFVGFGWIEKKIKNIWDILDHVISMLTRILHEIDPDIWKSQVERCCIFRTFSNQRGFCMWFVAVIDKKKYPFYIAV